MATSHQTSRSQTRPFVQHLKNRRAIHLNLKRNSQNNLCVFSKTKLSNYQCHNMVNLPISRHKNLSHYDYSTLKTGSSKAHRHNVKFNSSNSLNCNIKHDLSSPQLHAVGKKYEDILPKLRPDKISSHLHLRLNTSEDLRKVRIDGSPFEVRSNYNFFYPLKEAFII
jgi:hypothetical protein